jgi:MoxR-like ATPase
VALSSRSGRGDPIPALLPKALCRGLAMRERISSRQTSYPLLHLARPVPSASTSPSPPKTPTSRSLPRLSASRLPPEARAYVPPAQRFRAHLQSRLETLRERGVGRDEAIASLFPRTILPPETYEDVLAALYAGAHLLFFGPSGSGKTNLAKDLWEIFPKEVWAVEDCPVLDHPASLLDEDVARISPPCPVCVRRFSPDGTPDAFDPKALEPDRLGVVRQRLREGYGFARLQGSSEVFPDHLTGNVNLVKLEEVGDPMSPLVLEPGKLLQANQGLLLVDEIGKLPLGTQNVLLQALQEGTVTPAKSRESFPARFVAVCTSNLSDLDNINDPLSDRLASVHVDFNRQHSRNRLIVDRALPDPPTRYLPEILLDAGVRVVELWRQKMSDDNPDVGEVGSNRTLIDVAYRTEAFAHLRGHAVPDFEDLQAGLLHSMRGRIRARSGDSFEQNSRLISEFLEKNVPEATRRAAVLYWCRFFRDRLGGNTAEGEQLVGEGRRLVSDPSLQSRVLSGEGLFPRFQTLALYVGERDRLPTGMNPIEAALVTFQLLERFSLFTCPEGAPDEDTP